MPINNFKLFDEKKANMMSDDDYAINQQRLNGVQSGVASSQLQNKTLYQTALMCYALAQLMAANGYDANDADAVSTFVNNMSASMVQKVVDKAKASDITAKTVGKWIDAAQFGAMKESVDNDFLKLAGGTMLGNLILNADPTQNLQAATKQYVDGKVGFETFDYVGQGRNTPSTSHISVTFEHEPKIIMILTLEGPGPDTSNTAYLSFIIVGCPTQIIGYSSMKFKIEGKTFERWCEMSVSGIQYVIKDALNSKYRIINFYW